MIQAVIFDFDGVIVDTEPLHYEAFQRVLVPHGLGYTWDEYVQTFIGFDDRDAFREAYRRAGVNLGKADLTGLLAQKARAFSELAQVRHWEPYPGVRALLEDLSGTLPVGLCSSALRSDIEPILSSVGHAGAFDVMVTADEVRKSKPDPESYLLTVKRLEERSGGVSWSRSECLAIEDTPAGVEAARQAGLPVLAVTYTHPEKQLRNASKVVSSLEGITVGVLQGWSFSP